MLMYERINQRGHQDDGSLTKNEGSLGLIRMIVLKLWLSDGRLWEVKESWIEKMWKSKPGAVEEGVL